jgi:two-component system OmpR family response regulator
MRVLYIDDDRINGLLFEEACRLDDSLEVQLAFDGEEALTIAREWRPDVLVVDLHLPDTDGFNLLRTLRDLPECSTLPAFLCTAEEPSDVLARAVEAGYLACWPKPIDVRATLEALRAVRARTT